MWFNNDEEEIEETEALSVLPSRDTSLSPVGECLLSISPRPFIGC